MISGRPYALRQLDRASGHNIALFHRRPWRQAPIRIRATSIQQFTEICQTVLEQPVPSSCNAATLESQLASLQPDDAKQRVASLVNVFGLAIGQSWLEKDPTLLLRTPDEIAVQLQAVAELVGFPPEVIAIISAEFPQWLSVPSEQLQQNYEDLSDLFSLDSTNMARVVATQPELLATPLRTVRNNLYEVSAALGVSSGSMIRAAPRFPALMTLTPARLQKTVVELAQQMGWEQQAVMSMLGANPRLASLDADALVGEWEGLKSLLEGHENWLAQLEALPPHLAAACLASSQLKQRLLFFKETGLLETRYVNMASILTQDDADFASKYKGYAKWLREKVAEQRRQQQPPSQGEEEVGDEGPEGQEQGGQEKAEANST